MSERASIHQEFASGMHKLVEQKREMEAAAPSSLTGLFRYAVKDSSPQFKPVNMHEFMSVRQERALLLENYYGNYGTFRSLPEASDAIGAKLVRSANSQEQHPDQQPLDVVYILGYTCGN
jgi:hypothetical protein